MMFSFKAANGHNHHIVHETKTAFAQKSAWTLCGEYFERGERGQRQPTCPSCTRLDNPLILNTNDWAFFRAVVMNDYPVLSRRSSSYLQLIKRDYIDQDYTLTRRGKIAAADWETTAVPMADFFGVMHAREPLRGEPRCNCALMLVDVGHMSLSRYEKLRKVGDQLAVTCLECLAK